MGRCVFCNIRVRRTRTISDRALDEITPESIDCCTAMLNEGLSGIWKSSNQFSAFPKLIEDDFGVNNYYYTKESQLCYKEEKNTFFLKGALLSGCFPLLTDCVGISY